MCVFGVFKVSVCLSVLSFVFSLSCRVEYALTLVLVAVAVREVPSTGPSISMLNVCLARGKFSQRCNASLPRKTRPNFLVNEGLNSLEGHFWRHNMVNLSLTSRHDGFLLSFTFGSIKTIPLKFLRIKILFLKVSGFSCSLTNLNFGGEAAGVKYRVSLGLNPIWRPNWKDWLKVNFFMAY